MVGYDSNMNTTLIKDALGRIVEKEVFSDPDDPYRPSSVYDGDAANGRVVAGSSFTFASNGRMAIHET